MAPKDDNQLSLPIFSEKRNLVALARFSGANVARGPDGGNSNKTDCYNSCRDEVKAG